MKHIKTFESFSINEEGLFDKAKDLLAGAKTLDIKGGSPEENPELKKLLDKHKADFSVKDGKAMGSKRALNMMSGLKSELGLDPMQALEAAMKIVDYNGFMVVDYDKSEWDAKAGKLKVIKAEGAASGKVF